MIFKFLRATTFDLNRPKAKSSGEDPRATGGLVSNLPHPRVNKTKQHTGWEHKKSPSKKSVDDISLHCKKVTKMAIIFARHPMRAYASNSLTAPSRHEHSFSPIMSAFMPLVVSWAPPHPPTFLVCTSCVPVDPGPKIPNRKITEICNFTCIEPRYISMKSMTLLILTSVARTLVCWREIFGLYVCRHTFWRCFCFPYALIVFCGALSRGGESKAMQSIRGTQGGFLPYAPLGASATYMPNPHHTTQHHTRIY